MVLSLCLLQRLLRGLHLRPAFGHLLGALPELLLALLHHGSLLLLQVPQQARLRCQRLGVGVEGDQDAAPHLRVEQVAQDVVPLRPPVVLDGAGAGGEAGPGAEQHAAHERPQLRLVRLLLHGRQHRLLGAGQRDHDAVAVLHTRLRERDVHVLQVATPQQQHHVLVGWQAQLLFHQRPHRGRRLGSPDEHLERPVCTHTHTHTPRLAARRARWQPQAATTGKTSLTEWAAGT